MGSVPIERPDTIPRVTPEVAAVFDFQHGKGLDDQYIDEILRIIAQSNPEYLDEVERAANRILEERGFDAKAQFISTIVFGYALLAEQGTVDQLEAAINQALPVDGQEIPNN